MARGSAFSWCVFAVVTGRKMCAFCGFADVWFFGEAATDAYDLTCFALLLSAELPEVRVSIVAMSLSTFSDSSLAVYTRASGLRMSKGSIVCYWIGTSRSFRKIDRGSFGAQREALRLKIAELGKEPNWIHAVVRRWILAAFQVECDSKNIRAVLHKDLPRAATRTCGLDALL